MTWWQWVLVTYVAPSVPIGIKRWPGTAIAPPFALPKWKRSVECLFVAITWLPQAVRLLWMEL